MTAQSVKGNALSALIRKWRLAVPVLVANLGALLVGLTVFVAAAAAEDNLAVNAARESIQAEELQQVIEVLADDTFEGREAGSRGGHAAGSYLVEQLKKLPVAPAGTTEGYYQVFGGQRRNILVLLEGNDAELKDEVIVVGAHYDHVGYGNRTNSYGPTGYIHNGADDNASGTALLLETIEAFAEGELDTRRSLLFIFFDGEEMGLLGSRHWVRNPTIPLARVRMMVNIDMVGRLRNQTLHIHGTRTAPGLRQLVSRQNRDENLKLDFTWKNRANSDHYPFYERDIPFVMLHSGLHDDYHRPSDDVEKINIEGVEQSSRLLFSLVHDLATRDELPPFRSASRGESEWQRRQQAQPIAPATPRLGVRWAAEEDDAASEGLTLTEVMAGSAADRAGLRRGDRVVEFAGDKVAGGDTFRGQVLWAKNPVAVKVVRSRPAEGEEETTETLSLQLDGTPVRLGISFRLDDATPGEAIVNRVTSGSPADRGGLELRDRIYQVAGKSFDGRDSFLALVNSEPGPIEMLIERQGHLRKVTLDVPPLRRDADVTTPSAADDE